MNSWLVSLLGCGLCLIGPVCPDFSSSSSALPWVMVFWSVVWVCRGCEQSSGSVSLVLVAAVSMGVGVMV